jgi:hypothetical protein
MVGKFTEVTEVLKNFPAANTTDFVTQTNTLGADLGSVLRVVTGYEGN